MANQVINNALLKISNEHRLIINYVNEIEKVVTTATGEEVLEYLRDRVGQFHWELRNHFQFEEEVFFPVALEAMPQRDLIAMILLLAGEHGSFLATVETSVSIVSGHLMGIPSQDKSELGELLRHRFQSLVQRLKSHAKREIMVLYPRMNQNHVVHGLLKDKMANLPPELKAYLESEIPETTLPEEGKPEPPTTEPDERLL